MAESKIGLVEARQFLKNVEDGFVLTDAEVASMIRRLIERIEWHEDHERRSQLIRSPQRVAGPRSRMWKFEMDIRADTADFTLAVPIGAEVLAVGMQGPHKLCMWMLCDEQAKRRPRTYEIVGTGYAVPDSGVYIGTVQLPLPGGVPVVHVFEVHRG